MGLVGLIFLWLFSGKLGKDIDSPRTWFIGAFIPWFGWQATLFAHFLINWVWKDQFIWYKVFELAWWTENPQIQTVNPIAFGVTNPVSAFLTWGTELLAAFVVVAAGTMLLHKGAGLEPPEEVPLIG